jgi:disulfide oxidoreductase YuzD
LIPQPSIQVTVFDNSQGEKCEGRCGLDFSAPGALESITELLNKLYEGRVQLEYLDLAQPSVSSAHPEIVEKVRVENLSLPLLLINGKLRISGYFDIRLLRNAIQVEMEIGRE